ENQREGVTALMVSGTLLAKADPMGTTATAATTRAIDPASTPVSAPRGVGVPVALFATSPLSQVPTARWVRSMMMASMVATHNEEKATKRPGRTFWINGMWVKSRQGVQYL